MIGCTYRHPHNHNIEAYSDYIQKCLNKLNKEKKDVYLAGDFNIDLLQYETNNKYRLFYNLMTSSGFLPLILQPTRITDESMTIIDNIYTNTFSKDFFSGNVLLEIADHLTQFVIVHKDISNLPISDKYKRDFTRYVETSFVEDLSIQNWNTEDDVHDRYKDLLTRLEGCVQRHAPLKKLKKKELKLQNKPWITTNILKKIKHRNTIFAIIKHEPENDHLKKVYKRFRNVIKRDIIASKKQYYSNYFDECKNNMKKTWKGINELITNISRH